MNKELSPELITRSIEALPALIAYSRGEVTLPTKDQKLGKEYLEAIRVYGEYCQTAYENPDIATLIFRHTQSRNDQIAVARVPSFQGRENIYLANQNEFPVLLFTVLENRDTRYPNTPTASEFKKGILHTYGDDPDNAWHFKDADLKEVGTATNLYHAAVRRFQPRDLYNATLLYYFVHGTDWLFGNTLRMIMGEKTGSWDEKRLLETVKAFQKANTILARAFA